MLLRGLARPELTAIGRTAYSAPVRLLLASGLLDRSKTFFDYGCGRGGDVERLRSEGFSASGWDPHYAPEVPIVEADVVNLGFVVNVIEDPAERANAIRKAFALSRGVLSIAVRLRERYTVGEPYGDGVLTSRKTFQRYYTQAEFLGYVGSVLDVLPRSIGPGVCFVFPRKASLRPERRDPPPERAFTGSVEACGFLLGPRQEL